MKEISKFKCNLSFCFRFRYLPRNFPSKTHEMHTKFANCSFYIFFFLSTFNILYLSHWIFGIHIIYEYTLTIIIIFMSQKFIFISLAVSLLLLTATSSQASCSCVGCFVPISVVIPFHCQRSFPLRQLCRKVK